MVQDNFLWQHVDQATRGDNILDLVLSTERNLVENLRITAPIGKSDHVTVQFTLCFDNQGKQELNLGFDYRRAEYMKISEELEGRDWNEEFDHETVNGMWKKFVDILNGLMEKYVPKFKGKGKTKPKWMDYRACRALKKKYQAWEAIYELSELSGVCKFQERQECSHW